MTIDVRINRDFEVDIPLGEIIFEINRLPIQQRLNNIAELLNEIDVEDIGDIIPEHREIVLKWLNRMTEKFKS